MEKIKTKVCKGCGEEKIIHDFSRCPSAPDFAGKLCKVCTYNRKKENPAFHQVVSNNSVQVMKFRIF